MKLTLDQLKENLKDHVKLNDDGTDPEYIQSEMDEVDALGTVQDIVGYIDSERFESWDISSMLEFIVNLTVDAPDED